jgi:Phosphotransferase enzyme family
MAVMFERVDYPHESPATEGLARLGGDGWSAFVKVVRSFRHWPRWASLPPEARDVLGDASVWRHEVALYTSELGDLLPAGMRLPGLHGVVDLGDDRMVLVLEDVDVDSAAWDRERYARAARLLGQLHVRMTAAERLPRRSTERPAELANIMYTSRLLPVALPALSADATWRHPLLAGETTLRADLAELARRLPDLVAVAARLPQLYGHGDASPHNLLVPNHQPDTFVVIDWAMAGLAAAGDDLGQLLIGHAHDGVLAVDDLPALHELLVQAYVAGLGDEGYRLDEDVVRAGMDTGLSVRSAFTALPLERLDEPITDDLRRVFAGRIALTRYLVDLGLEVDLGRLVDFSAA